VALGRHRAEIIALFHNKMTNELQQVKQIIQALEKVLTELQTGAEPSHRQFPNLLQKIHKLCNLADNHQ
jgi:hemerythrin-like domain-containing protein